MMNKRLNDARTELSVIIVNYNTGKLLKGCVESVIKSYSGCEIIVVDNNSTDESVKSITGIKGIKIIENKENPGFSKANNQGIKQAKGEYILLLNPDTKVLGSAVEQLLDFAKANKEVGAVVPQLLNSDETVQDSIMHLPTIPRAIQEFWFGQLAFSKFVPKFTKPTEVEAAVMAAFLITPQALEKVGRLNEKYFMYFEDLDYCRKLKLAGLKIYYLPGAKVIHYHGVSGKSLASSSNQWRRLIPGSKLYHGSIKHFLITLVILLSKKLKK